MYRLTVNGKPIGQEFENEHFVIQAYLRMHPVILGLGWTKCQ